MAITAAGDIPGPETITLAAYMSSNRAVLCEMSENLLDILGKHEWCLLLLQVTSLDLRTNVLAAYVSGNRAHEVPAVMEAMKISSKDSFEIGFNTACGLLTVGDYAKAQSELEHAQRLGKHCRVSSNSQIFYEWILSWFNHLASLDGTCGMSSLTQKMMPCSGGTIASQISIIQASPSRPAHQFGLTSCSHAVGRETLLDEDLTDEQIEDELAPVTVQLAYAKSQLGNPAEALSTYEVTPIGHLPMHMSPSRFKPQAPLRICDLAVGHCTSTILSDSAGNDIWRHRG